MKFTNKRKVIHRLNLITLENEIISFYTGIYIYTHTHLPQRVGRLAGSPPTTHARDFGLSLMIGLEAARTHYSSEAQFLQDENILDEHCKHSLHG